MTGDNMPTVATHEQAAARLLLRRIVNRLAVVLMFAQGPREGRAIRRFYHADGRCACSVCGEEYWRHAVDPYDTWLHVLCNGERVKL